MVKDSPVTVTLELARESMDDPVLAAVGRLTLHVLAANGSPAQGAEVLLRDAKARPGAEHWGRTNAGGAVNLEVTDNSSVLVIVYDDQLYTFPANTYDTERTVRLP